MIKISIVVPIYNVEQYLSRCIESILAQSYTNIEVILVNDGSTDNCLKLSEKFATIDNRVHVINQSNIGLPAARNSGLKVIDGTYVGFIDSDDSIESNMVEEFVKIIDEHRGVDVVTSDMFQYEIGNQKYFHVRNSSYKYEELIHKERVKDIFMGPYINGDLGNIPSVCNKIYRVEFLKSNNILFDESLKRAADYWFNLEVFSKVNTIYSIDQSFYHYYANEGSNIRKYRKDQFELFLESRQRFVNEFLKFGIKINWSIFDANFTNNINEFILLMVKNESFFV